MGARFTVIGAILAWSAVAGSLSDPARAESMYVFGIHNWGWGANVDVMSWLTGWTTEADLSRDSPNVGGRYEPMVGEGFTIIQRLDWTWDDTIPPEPGSYPTFANQCASNWASNIKRFCRHYLIANEMDLFGVGPAEYVPCFQQVRAAIKAVQPEAKVIIGHFCNENHLRTTMQMLGPDGYDGICDHTPNSLSDSKLEMLDQENARPGVGMYITEWGWVAGTNGNARQTMMQFCQEIQQWNATHERQAYAATWYRYPCWDTRFTLECTEVDNLAFEYMTLNCGAANSYGNSPVIISNPRVEVSSSSKTLVARWETNLPSKTMLWYWNPLANPRNGEFRPLQSSLVLNHTITMDHSIHVQQRTEYFMICRSPADDLGDGAAGPLKVTTGPWTITAEDITPTSAKIRWQTIFPSTTRVEYGRTTAYGSEATGGGNTLDHVVQLDHLDPSTTYHYRVWSEAAGYAPHHSGDRTFQTSAPTVPLIQVSPEAIEADGYVGANRANSSFTVRNSGATGTITYSITPGCTWLSVDPPTGTSTGEEDTIQIVYSNASLGEGEHTCEITVEAPEAANSPILAPVVTLALTTLPVDFDEDGDVDLDDFGHFQMCLTGPGYTQAADECQAARLDTDDDVDTADLAIFVGCLRGAHVAPDPTCMN